MVEHSITLILICIITKILDDNLYIVRTGMLGSQQVTVANGN